MLLSLIHENNGFWNKNSKKSFPLFMKKVNFGVHITNVQKCILFRKYHFLGQKCKLFREYHFLGVRSVNFFENIILGFRSVNFRFFLRLHANFHIFKVKHVFECLIDGFRSWEGRNRHRMDLL